MKRSIIGAILAVSLGLGTTAVALVSAGTASGAPRTSAHIVGMWADDTNFGDTSGGWELFSNGNVIAFQGAPNYGNATSHKLNNFVGMVGDVLGNGYWLVTSTGAEFGFGSVCEGEHLVRPAGVPSSGIVGAIDLKSQTTEGFGMVTSKGATYQFKCEFSD